MEEREVLQLLKKYRANQCTAEERAVVESWLIHMLKDSAVPAGELDYDALERQIWANVVPRRVPSYFRYAAAILIIMAAVTSTFYYAFYHHTPTQITKEIMPGGNSATLTLANGKQINLNAANGKVLTDSSVSVSNNSAGGILTYQLTNSKAVSNAINTIATPRGGQYQLILSDGTRVFLNSDSKISFPAHFGGQERGVTLVGEAYFEVAKNTTQPFIVNSKDQKVRVLGTHFNITAYPGEPVKTTLAEGSVELQQISSLKKQLLKPGQQALLNDNAIQVSVVDVSDEIAWIDGMFIFRQTPLSTVFKEISRWYDVEVDYSSLPDKLLSAELPRTFTLSQILHNVEFTSGLKFKVEGRKLSVIK